MTLERLRKIIENLGEVAKTIKMTELFPKRMKIGDRQKMYSYYHDKVIEIEVVEDTFDNCYDCEFCSCDLETIGIDVINLKCSIGYGKESVNICYKNIEFLNKEEEL